MSEAAGADFDVVTGASSYSGAAIAREVQASGRRVRTLTGHPGRVPKTPAGTAIEVRPLDFADPAGLTESLRGARTLYNTYWVRFARGEVDHPAPTSSPATSAEGRGPQPRARGWAEA